MDRAQFQAIRGLHYPAIPAFWPNRAVRRAVKQGRESRNPGEWRAAFVTRPLLRQAVRLL